mgnify:FL=1
MPSDDASTFTFQKALDDRDLLVLDIEYADGDRMTRCPASMFWHDGGLLWVDTGWQTDPAMLSTTSQGRSTGTVPGRFLPTTRVLSGASSFGTLTLPFPRKP